MTGRFIEDAIRAIRLHWRREMTPELLEISIALRRYFREQGSLPESLRELVPGHIDSVPVDPLTGNAVHYERTTGGYEIRAADRRTLTPGSRLVWRSYIVARHGA